MLFENFCLTRGVVVCLTFLSALILLTASFLWRRKHNLSFDIGSFIYLLSVSFSSSSVLWWMTIPTIHYSIYEKWPIWCAPVEIASLVTVLGMVIIFIISVLGLIYPEKLYEFIANKKNKN